MIRFFYFVTGLSHFFLVEFDLSKRPSYQAASVGGMSFECFFGGKNRDQGSGIRLQASGSDLR